MRLRAHRSAATVMIIASAIAVASRPLSGQVVRGIVRDSTSQLPIAGAVVTTLDSLGRVGRRSLTNERGAYFVTTPVGARHLRIVRLGFRPVDVDVPVSRDSVATVDVVMARIPYTLQPVRVISGANCPRRSDRAAALALLEQARSGLLATVVARSENPAQMKRLMINRRLGGASLRVTRHQVRVESVSSTVAAFGAARTAADFVRQGFATDSGEGHTFFAPDADVLLDDGFAAGYCFHVMDRNRARPNQIGLGFRAPRRRDGRIDVDGALWIDTLARALVDIEFRYVGLDPRLAAYEPGGRVAFRELPNGVVLIDRWMLRLVGTEPDTARLPLDPVGRVRETALVRMLRIVVADVGGELARATWPDGYAWFASLGTLSLTVTTDQGLPLANTRVRLDDTNYEATTDSAGRLQINDLAPGPYSAVIADPRLDPVGVTLETPLSFTATRGQTMLLNLRAKTAEDYVAERCQKDRTVINGTAWVLGRVTAPGGEPVGGVSWTMRTLVRGVESELASGSLTGTDGIFAHCGAPRYATLYMTFRKNGMATGSISRVLNDSLTVIAVEMTPERRRD
jgi:hypothetical protein